MQSVGDGEGRPPGIAKYMVTQRRVPGQNQISQSLLVELGLLGPQHMARPTPTLPQSQSLLVKIGLLSQSTASHWNPKSQCALVKLGRLGPEQVASPAQAKWQQTRSLLLKLGLLGLRSTALGQNLDSQCRVQSRWHDPRFGSAQSFTPGKRRGCR